MKRHLLFSAFLSVIIASIWILSSAHGSAQSMSFLDIKSPLLQEAVGLLVEQGIIDGYPNGTFRPEQTINRAEALKMIFASRGLKAKGADFLHFSDVKRSDWFYPYVSQAFKRRLVQGYEDETYRPAQNVNTVEFIKIAMLAQDFYQFPSLEDFRAAGEYYEDVSIGDWFMPVVAFAHKRELLEKSSKLDPGAVMTRGQAALIIARALQRSDELKEKRTQAVEELKKRTNSRCPMCVAGVDFSSYEWAYRPYVRIADNKIEILGVDETRCFRTGCSNPDNFGSHLEMYDERYFLENTPREEKLSVDAMFPDFYDRAISIHGGSQVGDRYFGGQEDKGHERVIRNRDGIDLGKCDCLFEEHVLHWYNTLHSEVPFEELLQADDGKVLIFDSIYHYSLRPDYQY